MLISTFLALISLYGLLRYENALKEELLKRNIELSFRRDPLSGFFHGGIPRQTREKLRHLTQKEPNIKKVYQNYRHFFILFWISTLSLLIIPYIERLL